MLEIGENAKKASHSISVLNSKKKNDILLHAAENLMKNKKKILHANNLDIEKTNQLLTQLCLIV